MIGFGKCGESLHNVVDGNGRSDTLIFPTIGP
jgi:hypothetical protein